MYSLPQEIEVWYIIPSIRKELSKIFVKEYGLTLEKAGNILGISKAAVSQYLNKKRASKFKMPPKIMKEIKKSADKVVKNEKLAVAEIEKILKIMRQEKCSCEFCKKYNPEIIKLCDMKTQYS